MDSSPDGMLSPALSPENDEYASALAEYDDLSVEAAKRFEAFGEADANFKDLQERLHELLTLGDSLWDEALGASKGSAERRAALDGLHDATWNIRKTVGDQDKTLESLDRSVSKAARGLARLTETVATVRRHAAGVRRSLDERIDEMKALEPGLSDRRSSRSPGSKERAKEQPKEPKQSRAKEAAKELERERRREEKAQEKAQEQERTERTELERLRRKEKERSSARTRSQERPRTAQA